LGTRSPTLMAMVVSSRIDQWETCPPGQAAL
jgi:hypothetical protein